MTSPVSFGSTYRIKTQHNDSAKQKEGYGLTQAFCNYKNIPFNEKTSYEITDSYFGIGKYSAETSIVSPDDFDKTLEVFLKNHGVDYHKYSAAELTEPDAVISRISAAPDGYKKVLIDSEKLDKILKKQSDNNFEHCKSDYDKYYKERTDFILKSGDEITAPTLHITPKTNKDYYIDYISQKGADKLIPDTLFIDLDKRTSEPDHCMYFELQNAGLKDIPVYVGKDTYEICSALGIIKDN